MLKRLKERILAGGDEAPATFEWLMERVLSGLAPKVCLVYVDDLFVHGLILQEL